MWDCDLVSAYNYLHTKCYAAYNYLHLYFLNPTSTREPLKPNDESH